MTAMYSGPAHGEPLRPFPHHERHVSYPIERSPFKNQPRTHVELPRLLEPRPNHASQPPVVDASSRRPDLFRGTAPASEHRPQSHNLPRLHDILTSTSSEPAPPAYSSSWSNTAAPTDHRQNGDSTHGHAGYRPSSAHPTNERPPYQAPTGRRMDLPVLQTSPAMRHDSHSAMTPASYGAHRDAREHAGLSREAGHRPPTGPYSHNGMRSPYASIGHDESHYQNSAMPMERPGNHAYPSNGPAITSKYIGIRDIPGEGQFHVYEGGQRIPTAVDGESVNPAWGLTKANKPRKRLAMACLDCREKKIKCEPGAVSCLQCEKAKRTCRKAPAHQSQSDTASASVWSNSAGSPPRQSAGDLSSPNRLEIEPDMSQKRRAIEDPSAMTLPAKKHRSASPLYRTNGGIPTPATATNHQVSPVMQTSLSPTLAWEEDPFAIDPEATMRLTEYYFQDVNDATYCMLPRRHFLHWLRTCTTKTQNERLLIYAILAVGSIFNEDAYGGFGRRCAEIASDALQGRQGRFNTPVVQARLLLGLYHFAKGSNSTAWDFISSGVDAATYLGYNTEEGCSEDDSAGKSRAEFDFLPEQFVECKRRTLWSAFLMDRYCGGRSTMINPQDIFLRLPCFDDVYERGQKSDAPYFNNGIVDPVKASLSSTSPIAPMSWLCLIGAVWGDVVNFVSRAVHRSPLVYEEDYEKFYEQTRTALQNWTSRLPEQLQFTEANVERSIRGGYAGPYISMHLLYHLSWVKMNRFVRHSLIKKSITRNVRATHRHSHELLQVMSTVRSVRHEMGLKHGYIGPFSFTTPFAGYAILAAIDVVGAGGLDTHLNDTVALINCGCESLRELANYWSSARDQDKACEKRYFQIQNVLKHPFTARSGCWLGREWGIYASLEKEFSRDDDCIYGTDDRVFFDALREDAFNSSARNL